MKRLRPSLRLLLLFLSVAIVLATTALTREKTPPKLEYKLVADWPTLPDGLKLPPDYFVQFYRKPLIQVRLLHYLPQDQQAALEGGDSRAHQDAGGFTMLQQDDVGGLEIKSKSGEWLIVPPVENSFVVNIGDSMRLWTNNRFASTLHRVVNHYGRERYSVGIFANPDYDTVIRPLSTCVHCECRITM